MATFTTKSRDAAGQLIERTVEAGSTSEVIATLERCGLSPIEIHEVLGAATASAASAAEPGEVASRRGPGSMRLKELRRFTIQLSSALKAGVPILAGLRAIADDLERPGPRRTLGELVADVESGVPLSGAMRRHPRAFPGVYAGTVEAGEESGTLEQVLDNLIEYLESEIELRADVRSAVLYPAIVLAALSAAIAVLIVFVVPRFASFYSSFDDDLPLVTRVLIDGTDLAKSHGLWIAAGVAALGSGLWRLLRVESVRRLVDRVVLRVPVFGHMVETAVTLRVVQMLELFTGAGVPMLAGLRTIAGATRNTRARGDLYAAADGIEEGGTLAAGLERASCFPVDARQILTMGEQTGSLQRSCAVVAQQYRRELRYLTRNLATFIEPVLTLVLALIVLFVALAAFLPMWDMVRVVRR
ncbi:MAG: type II secretion system F family protein [Planctomycetota bacterium]